MKQVKKAKGVRILDSETKEVKEYYAKVIFLCASAFGSTQILLNSTSDRYPQGFGNDSGEVGCNVMDHHFQLGAKGKSEDVSR
jgi:choline dehydrogenase-like flavoprotein